MILEGGEEIRHLVACFCKAKKFMSCLLLTFKQMRGINGWKVPPEA